MLAINLLYHNGPWTPKDAKSSSKAHRVVNNNKKLKWERDIEEKETNIPNLEQRLLAQQSAAGSKKGEKKKDAQCK